MAGTRRTLPTPRTLPRTLGPLPAAMAAFAALVAPALVARGGNIAVSGFNEDVVTEAGVGRFGHRFDAYTPNPCDWAVNGLSDGAHTAVGLPVSGTFTSATGSGVVYQLQPYNGKNVLRTGDGDPASATLNVVPGQYRALHVLAASATDGSAAPRELGQSSDITLNFAGGSVTLPGALIAYDWSVNAASLVPPPTAATIQSAVALGGLDRNQLGASQVASSLVSIDALRPRGFAMYETPLDLNALGLSGRVLDSITFNDVNPTHSATGVFAVDGTPAPEPAGLPLLGGAVAAVAAGRRRRGGRGGK